mmetsp:Transcript_32713/g.84721  ORF Transcript_32713/g.84721 Transcript_32713/m.84721 type:complete len:256 (-) Transcript_32713:93-860(-)
MHLAGPRGRDSILLRPRLLHEAQLRILGIAALDVLLAIVPGPSGIRHGDGELHGRDEGAREEAEDRLHAKESACDQRGADDQCSGANHLPQRRLRRNCDAPVIVRLDLCAAGEDAQTLRVCERELPLYLLHHFAGGLANGLHGESCEPVRVHGSDQHEREGHRLHDVDPRQVHVHIQALEAHHEGAVERQRHQRGRADGEALADGSGRVARRVQGVSALAHVGRELRHLRDAARIVGDRAEAVDGEAGREGGEHA